MKDYKKMYNIYRYHYRLISIFLFLFTTVVRAADVNVPPEVQSDSQKGVLLESIKTDVGRFPKSFIDGTMDTFSDVNNLFLLSLAGVASVVMNNTDADKNIQDDVRHHRMFKGFSDESLNITGYPATHFSAAALWYVLAAGNNDRLNTNRAFTMINALAVDGAIILALKAARDEPTPNNKGWGWPSGHTSSSFTFASVLDEYYGPMVGIPAYIVASLVGYRMVDTDDHWASDVVFGATLGWVVGHTIAGKEKTLELAGFSVLPYIPYNEPSAVGIGLVKRF
jgi:membrane-associated phospholipid phosphatase